MVRCAVAYRGLVHCNASMLDRASRELLDVSQLNGMGWRAKMLLEDGVRITYEWYQRQMDMALT